MKIFSVIIFLTFVLWTNAFSVLLNNNAKNENKQQNIAYSLVLPSKFIDGNFIPQKTVNIEQLSSDKYFKNVVEIKTKDYQKIDLNFKNFENGQLQSALSMIDIKAIRSPYMEYFSGDKLLSDDKFGVGRIYEVRYEGDLDPYQVCKLLIENPEVEYAVPVFKRYAYGFTPNDPMYAQQYHLTKINMADAWDVTGGDPSVVIAIVDTGTDINHQDLKANIWTNPKEIPGNGKDDDGNGKIDDVNGWDFIGSMTNEQLSAGQYKEDNDPSDDLNSHGSHTAGCASSVTNNSLGVAAPAYKCKIMPVKCASDAVQSMGILRGYEGVMYAAKTGAKIISCSWGGPGWSPSEEDIVNQVTNMGVLLVVAAGNSTTNLDVSPDYPAGFKGVLSVGSSGSTDKVSGFSSYGNLVSVFAPGEAILSTIPKDKYDAQDGTSMACPLTAGVAALVLSIHKDWTPAQVIHQLRSTTDNVLVSTNPTYRPYFFGRINAGKALQYNNSAYPDLKVPGISLENITIGTKNYLNTFDQVDIKISIKNYLAPAENVTIKLINADNFIQFDQTTFTVGALGTMELKELPAKVTLSDNCPWYKGQANVMLEITGKDYINYVLATIKIDLLTDNQMTTYSSLSSNYQVKWSNSAFGSENTIYMLGESPYIGGFALKADGSGSKLMNITNQPVYCLYSFDDNNFIAGDGSTTGGTIANLYYSNNAGTNWTKKSIASITSFVNSLNFFNSKEGILIGDPKAGVWGVAKSTDAGQTWTRISTIPAPTGSETALVGSVQQLNDTVWFGTTAGRIFKTTDKGATWTVSTVFVGGVISSLGFNESIGACIYAESNAQNANRLLATTTDGGKTWITGIYNFTANNYFPLYVYAIQDSKTFVVQLSNGYVFASDNNGASWYPILSEEKSSYTYAIAKQTGNLVSMYAAGATDITRLDFAFQPAEIKKLVAFTSGGIVQYDSVYVSKTKDIFVDIKNNGNTLITVSSMNIVADEISDSLDFKIVFNYPKTMEPGQTYQVKVRFQPKSIGKKTAKLIVSSDAQNPVAKLDLVGFGLSNTDVEENLNSNLFTISPNPTSQYISLTNNGSSEILRLKVMDIKGSEQICVDKVNLNLPINISNLTSGVYYFIIETTNGSITKQFIVIK